MSFCTNRTLLFSKKRGCRLWQFTCSFFFSSILWRVLRKKNKWWRKKKKTVDKFCKITQTCKALLISGGNQKMFAEEWLKIWELYKFVFSYRIYLQFFFFYFITCFFFLVLCTRWKKTKTNKWIVKGDNLFFWKKVMSCWYKNSQQSNICRFRFFND